jgi:3-deoxy-D-manno-octulosonic-acid transferase
MLYRVTPVAVIGGSFLSGLAGHNISEAAAAGCAVMTGELTYLCLTFLCEKVAIFVVHKVNSGMQDPMLDTSTICWLKCGK